MSISAERVKDIAMRAMGGIGASFIDKQFNRLGINPSALTEDDVKKLADEAKKNSVLLIGMTRAEQLYTQLMNLLPA